MRKAVLLVALLIASTLPAYVSADDDPIRQRQSSTDFSWSGNDVDYDTDRIITKYNSGGAIISINYHCVK